MRIDQFRECQRFFARRHADLLNLLQERHSATTRPCHGCTITCECLQHSSACLCGCSPACPYVGEQLSSDPANYPIETNILPLVYALAASRVLQPCWSCEGHYHANGVLHKIPEVWFYTSSMVYSELLSQYILSLQRTLHYPWAVSHSRYSPDTGSTMFRIHPELMDTKSSSLTDMHEDIRVMSEHMPRDLLALARTQKTEMEALIRDLA